MPTTSPQVRHASRRMRTAIAVTAAMILGCGGSSSSETAGPPPNPFIASVSTGGAQGNGASTYNALSGDGRALVFESAATNLGGTVAGGGTTNIYLRDLAASRTTLLSRGWDNSTADGRSSYPSVNDNATRAAFQSLATNLVENQAPPTGQVNVYVVDLPGGGIARASISWDNTDADGDSGSPSLSGDGRFVAFDSTAGNLTDPPGTPTSKNVYVRDLSDNTTRLVSVAADNVSYGNDQSLNPVISRNGRYVAFRSMASDLVAGDTNGRADVFLRDLVDNTTTRVGVDNAGAQVGDGVSNSKPDLAIAVSPNGRYVFVAFVSYDNAIVPFDNNADRDVFLRVIDTVGGPATTELVSVAAGGTGVGNHYSDRPAVSDDGRFVLFRSESSNLVSASDPPGVAQYYLRDRTAGTTRRISRSTDPLPTPRCAGYGSMNGDGAMVSFEHNSETVVAGDANGTSDVFVFRTR